jgi:hypothetical protein
MHYRYANLYQLRTFVVVYQLTTKYIGKSSFFIDLRGHILLQANIDYSLIKHHPNIQINHNAFSMEWRWMSMHLSQKPNSWRRDWGRRANSQQNKLHTRMTTTVTDEHNNSRWHFEAKPHSYSKNQQIIKHHQLT